MSGLDENIPQPLMEFRGDAVREMELPISLKPDLASLQIVVMEAFGGFSENSRGNCAFGCPAGRTIELNDSGGNESPEEAHGHTCSTADLGKNREMKSRDLNFEVV